MVGLLKCEHCGSRNCHNSECVREERNAEYCFSAREIDRREVCHVITCQRCYPSKKKSDVRESILDQAKKIVTTNRNKSYGEPEQNFNRIASLWNAYLQGKHSEWKFDLNPGDVAIMMVLMKIARLEESPENWDSWLDGIGYLACGAQTVFDSPPKEEA